MAARELLDRIKTAYQSILQDKLVGLYVHGSLAFGCFHWERSDIDFLAVVNAALTQAEKEALISTLLRLDADAPPKGFEMSVVLDRVCKPFVYPTPYELHFSNGHKAAYRQNLAEHCRALCGTDRDLAAHITIIHKVGFPLCGKPVSEVFAPVPAEDYTDSILYDIADAASGIPRDPVYYTLNLCRVLAYLEDGRILSKQQGGAWGLCHLPAVYHPLICNALTCYTASAAWTECPLLPVFAQEMLARIDAIHPHRRT